jgi:hypothetical protein
MAQRVPFIVAELGHFRSLRAAPLRGMSGESAAIDLGKDKGCARRKQG